MTLTHACQCEAGCDDCERSLRAALHDAIVDGDRKLERVCRDGLAELAVAREALPVQREADGDA